MPRHVIIARDPLIAHEGVDRLIPAGCRVERSHVSDLDLNLIFNQLGTADLFATERCYHYRDFLGLNLGKNQQDRLRDILNRLPAEVSLICSQVLEYDKRADETRALKGQLYATWTAGVKVTDLRGIAEGAKARAWVTGRAREKYRLTMSDSQAQRLLLTCQDKPSLADTELRKLWMFKDSDTLEPVSDHLLQSVLSTNPGACFYEMVDALFSRAPRWQEQVDQWYSIEPDTHKFVNEFKRRLLGLLDLQRGIPVQPPFFGQQLQRCARQWPAPRLSAAIQRLAGLEYALKSGRTTGATSKDGDYSALQLFLVDTLA